MTDRIDMDLSDRQRREIEYHRQRAAEHATEAIKPVSLEAVSSEHYRWWNAYWVILRKAKQLGLAGKRVLVVGCGFGEDAIQLSSLGAAVCAIDISAESVDIARQRASTFGAVVQFAVSPAERLPYQDKTFDLVYLPDVVHHLDVPAAAREVRRVLKPDGIVLGNEPYTHSWIQALRESRLVRGYLYQKMVKHIYGTTTPYITADERKLDERDFRQIDLELPITEKHYFLLVTGRLLPIAAAFAAKVDRVILMIPFIGHLLAGRVVYIARQPGALSR